MFSQNKSFRVRWGLSVKIQSSSKVTLHTARSLVRETDLLKEVSLEYPNLLDLVKKIFPSYKNRIQPTKNSRLKWVGRSFQIDRIIKALRYSLSHKDRVLVLEECKTLKKIQIFQIREVPWEASLRQLVRTISIKKLLENLTYIVLS